MTENKRYYAAAGEEKRGASEKPLGSQVSKEAQKASRKFLTNEQKPGCQLADESWSPQASKSNQDS